MTLGSHEGPGVPATTEPALLRSAHRMGSSFWCRSVGKLAGGGERRSSAEVSVIGRLTNTAMTASCLALAVEQMNWPRDQEDYDRLRIEAQQFLSDLECDVPVAATQEEHLQAKPALSTLIVRKLAEERGRILGDTVALPIFFLNSLALRAVINAALGTGDGFEREAVQDCLEDLGLDRDLITHLDREAGWVVLDQDGGPDGPNIRHVDIIKAGGSFITRVLEEFGRTEAGPSEILDELRELTSLVGDFRDEQRQANAQIQKLVHEGNEALLETMKEIEAALVAQGVTPGEATKLVEAEPGKLWDRVVRWFGGSGPRDATEAALWAALEFVPAGTGVKLGIRIAQAVRGSIKESAKDATSSKS